MFSRPAGASSLFCIRPLANGDFEFAAVNSSFLGTADDNDGVDGDVTSGLGNLRNDNDLDGDVQEKVNPSS